MLKLLSPSVAALCVLCMQPAHADYIGVTLEWISGSLLGQVDEMTIEVTELPAIGGGLGYSPQSGRLVDIDLTIAGNNFDEDDEEGFPNPLLPFMSFERLTATTGDKGDGRFDMILDTINGNFTLFGFAQSFIDEPINNDDVYSCRYREDLGEAAGPGGQPPEYLPSFCRVTAVSMAEAIDDLEFGGSLPSSPTVAQTIRFNEDLGPIVYRDAFPLTQVSAPPALAVFGMGLVALGIGYRRARR